MGEKSRRSKFFFLSLFVPLIKEEKIYTAAVIAKKKPQKRTLSHKVIIGRCTLGTRWRCRQGCAGRNNKHPVSEEEPLEGGVKRWADHRPSNLGFKQSVLYPLLILSVVFVSSI